MADTNKAARKDMFMVPFGLLQIVEDFNVRYDMGDVKALAASIAENGVKVPMRGYHKKGVYYITDGHRRFKALQILDKSGYTELQTPFVLEEKGYSDEERTLDLLLANDGKKLTLLEEAEVFKRLVDNFGRKPKEIGNMSGKSTTHVENCLMLLKAEPELLDKVRKEIVSASTVIEMLRKKDAKQVAKEVKEAEEKLSTSGSKRKKVTAKDMKAKPRRNISKDLIKMLTEVKEEKKDVNEDYLYFAEKLLEYYEGELDYAQMKGLLQNEGK